ncbi:hypothetical protein ABKN59_002002 [Abortiporus biennis]
MVVLSPRFALLASLSIIASFSSIPCTVDGAVIQARRPQHNGAHHGSSRPSSQPNASSGSRGQPSSSDPSLLSTQNVSPPGALAGPAAIAGVAASNPGLVTGFLPIPAGTVRRDIPNLAGLVSGALSDHALDVGGTLGQRADGDDVVVNGDNSHVHIHGNNGKGKVVVKGSNDNVHVHRRSPHPEPRRHHRHHGHGHDSVVVKGNDDHVRVKDRRSVSFLDPLLAEGIVLVKSLARRRHHHDHYDDILVEGDHDKVDVHRRDSQPEGTPGSVDIMSPVAESSYGQKIASLVVASSATEGSPLLLNASGTNQTQVYLVPKPTDSTNSTTPGNSSNSTRPYILVSLEVPVFESQSAEMKRYCATFDPQPSSPSPLTVESCMGDNEKVEHKSQTFAYDPNSGAIRPMWFNGDDDGTHPDTPDGGTTSEDGGNVETDPNAGPSVNSTSIAPIDPRTPTNNKMASITSIEKRSTSDIASQFDDANTLAADSQNAQNVTLMFTPSTPEIVSSTSQRKLAEQPVGDSFASSSSISTPLSSSTMLSSTSTATSSPTPIAADFSSTTPSSTDSGYVTSIVSTDSVTPTATPTSGALGVEVYDPNVTTAPTASSSDTAVSSTSTASSTASVNTQGVESSSSASPSSSYVSTSTSSPSPSVTPVSTQPYEWMFREGTVKGE